MNKARAAYTDEVLFQAEEEAAAATKVRVSFLDLTPLLCSGTTCPVVTPSGVLMYRDSQHLVIDFALSLEPALSKRIVPLVRGNAKSTRN